MSITQFSGSKTSDLDETEAAETLNADLQTHFSAPLTTIVADDQAPTFTDLGVDPAIVAALSKVGITRAFAIQALTLPIAQAGSDLIAQARTGTGKTLGFGIPLLERITKPTPAATRVPQALVVVPTRELCVQVARDLSTAGSTQDIRVAALYGGRAYEPQVNALRRGVEVVVGTPGRLLDLAQQKILQLDTVSILVLDEADEMLDLGFLPDIERVLNMLPKQRQTMLFSATMPGPIISLARRFMNKAIHVRAENPGDGHTVPATDQHVFRTHPLDKTEVLARILQARQRGLAMVFCTTKRAAQKLSEELVERGFATDAVHGDLGQNAREQALQAFRVGKINVLVATDVAARGIDVAGVTHVVNFQCPDDEKTYLHRIGRTGRAGASGVAVTFVDWEDTARWQLINQVLQLPFADPLETYSTSEHLYTQLDIPADAIGELPVGQRIQVSKERGGGTGSRRQRSRRRKDTSQQQTNQSSATKASLQPDTQLEPKLNGEGRSRRRTRGGKPVAAEVEDRS